MVVVTSTANVPGDVVNNAKIGPSQNPVLIQNGATIGGAFINNSTVYGHIEGNRQAGGTASAAGILDLSPGAPVIQNNGLVTANATATGAKGNAAIAVAGGVVQGAAFTGVASQTILNNGKMHAGASATAKAGGAD